MYKKGVSFSSGISWGAPSFFVNGEKLQPVTTGSADTFPVSVINYTTAPLQNYELALTFSPPKHLRFIIGITYRRQRVYHEFHTLPDPVQKSANRFTYQSFGLQSGFLYRHKAGPINIIAGMQFNLAYATWHSNVIFYTSTPSGNVRVAHGDKHSNAANGIEVGVKIISGIEYVLLKKIGISVQVNAHPGIASLGFIQDWHLWENTESSKDHHTETLLDHTIEDENTFMIAPPLLGFSLGFTYYF